MRDPGTSPDTDARQAAEHDEQVVASVAAAELANAAYHAQYGDPSVASNQAVEADRAEQHARQLDADDAVHEYILDRGIDPW
jgi:hypothetical protein